MKHSHEIQGRLLYGTAAVPLHILVFQMWWCISILIFLCPLHSSEFWKLGLGWCSCTLSQFPYVSWQAGRICPCLTCDLALKPQHANVLLSLKAMSHQRCQAQQWLRGRLGVKVCCAVKGCSANSVLLAACSAHSWLGALSPEWMFFHCPRYNNTSMLVGLYPR